MPWRPRGLSLHIRQGDSRMRLLTSSVALTIALALAALAADFTTYWP